MSPLVLFFYFDRYQRYLQSFPTRRSSDLVTRKRAVVTTGCLSAGSGDPDFAATTGVTLCCELALACTVSEIPPKRDRKSTRLNSSHRCISYAVFCLKKKTTVTRTRPHELR